MNGFAYLEQLPPLAFCPAFSPLPARADRLRAAGFLLLSLQGACDVNDSKTHGFERSRSGRSSGRQRQHVQENVTRRKIPGRRAVGPAMHSLARRCGRAMDGRERGLESNKTARQRVLVALADGPCLVLAAAAFRPRGCHVKPPGCQPSGDKHDIRTQTQTRQP